MFDLGWAEMLLLGIVVLLVMGPRELPSMLRTLGRLARRMRVLSQGFRSQIDEISREVDPRADLQRITYSHPFEEDVGAPTLFDEPPEDEASSSSAGSEKPVPKNHLDHKQLCSRRTVSRAGHCTELACLVHLVHTLAFSIFTHEKCCVRV